MIKNNQNRDADAQPVVESVRPSLWEQRHEIAKAELLPHCPQCGVKLSEIEGGSV